ncbi:MAG TPA: hypothetical protein VFE60_05110 [Roseiarcus sp.]|jgi:hypothetical protein|nr:hypothetical protein [Roseiarcus sp.]
MTATRRFETSLKRLKCAFIVVAAEYEAMRRRIGLYNFSSQYQQRPIPISGNLVKREWLRS